MKLFIYIKQYYNQANSEYKCCFSSSVKVLIVENDISYQNFMKNFENSEEQLTKEYHQHNLNIMKINSNLGKIVRRTGKQFDKRG